MKLFDELDDLLNKKWKEILGESKLVGLIMAGDIDRKTYAQYLIETFHYTSHNAKNQALVCTNLSSTPQDIQYMKFCLKHALEETGHELMALHDIKAMGFNVKLEELPKPLPETQRLINYLYKISESGCPYQRLGYSYWAESSYHYFSEILKKIKDELALTPAMLTFFIEHSEIDDKHFKEIKSTIAKFVTKPEDIDALKKVMLKSLELTGEMLEAVYSREMRIRNQEERSPVEII